MPRDPTVMEPNWPNIVAYVTAAVGGGGGGGVASVNGQTGVVVLAAADIDDATLIGASILTAADSGAVRMLLDLEVGVDLQAHDADLDALAALSTTGFVERTGSGTATARALVAGDLPAGVPVLGGTPVEGDTPRHDGTAWQPVSEIPGLLRAEHGIGVDGALTLDGSAAITVAGTSISPSGGVYTLTRDVCATTVTCTASCTVNTAGFTLRCHKLVVNSGQTLTIHDDGNTATGISGAAALTGGSTDRTSGGGATALNTTGAPSSGSSQASPSLGGDGGAGGAAGSAGSAGGTATWTASSQQATGLPVHPTQLCTGRALQTATFWRGGGGGGAGRNATGAGTVPGGGGSGGGFCLVATALLDVQGNLTVRANGGAGASATGTNAGGGGGGGGGCAVLVRMRQRGAGTVTVQANGGAAGNGIGTGAAGTAGSAGRTYNIQVV